MNFIQKANGDIVADIKHFHLFCGLGGGAKGFNKGQARVGRMQAKFRCLGGVDSDSSAVRDFKDFAGVPGTCLDLFSREQYAAFHGRLPDPFWREATIADMHKAANNESPDIIFLSAPCKGFSGLLPEILSRTDKYQALNQLTLRGIWLALEAWKDDPTPLLIFENVPRIANRGRTLLDRITKLLRFYGYEVNETTHDCGELGGLAQSRKRFLLVARHMEKVPAFLYKSDKQPLRGVGEVIGKLPVPGNGVGGAMHRVPSLQWKTWVRLAFVQAGKDWRSLKRLKVSNGVLSDYLIVPETQWTGGGRLGVTAWNDHSGTIAGASRPENGAFSVADPRIEQSVKWHDGNSLGVKEWSQTAATIGGGSMPGQGAYSVADPRQKGPPRHNNCFRIVARDVASPAIPTNEVESGTNLEGLPLFDPRYAEGSMGEHTNKMRVVDWGKSANTVTGSDRVGSGAMSVADPRVDADRSGPLGVSEWTESARTIAGESFPTNGYFSVADPRVLTNREKGSDYESGGHYGVVPWHNHTGAVSASACHDNGFWSVADPRLPAANDPLVAVIQAPDGTWHRPFTTLELAALQSLIDPEEFLELDGLSDSAWRERIGNAVPSDAAAAIASVMGETLLLAATGETFVLSNREIWVQNLRVALSVQNLNYE